MIDPLLPFLRRLWPHQIWDLPLAALLFAVLGLPKAQAQLFDEPMSQRRLESSDNSVIVTGSSGVGSYQDIQVPMNPLTGARIDGSTATTQNTTHTGIPMMLEVADEERLDPSWTWRLIDFNAVRIQALNGAADTANAAYTRLDLGSSATYHYSLGGGEQLNAGLGVTARRSTFSNVTESHDIDSLSLSTHAGYTTPQYGLDLSAAYAPVARLGFSNDGYFSGHALSGSTASLSEVGASFTYKLRPGVWLETGLSVEFIQITVPDSAEYSALGLTVNSQDHSSQTYSLTTTLAHIGFKKAF